MICRNRNWQVKHCDTRNMHTRIDWSSLTIPAVSFFQSSLWGGLSGAVLGFLVLRKDQIRLPLEPEGSSITERILVNEKRESWVVVIKSLHWSSNYHLLCNDNHDHLLADLRQRIFSSGAVKTTNLPHWSAEVLPTFIFTWGRFPRQNASEICKQNF